MYVKFEVAKGLQYDVHDEGDLIEVLDTKGGYESMTLLKIITLELSIFSTS